MLRKIINIDDQLCTGCEECIPNCPEGAIQIIDGKARLVSDLFCDGLGACLGHCPEGAIEIEEREAEPYDERRVMANVARQGKNVVSAHLKHLSEHGETEYLSIALDYAKEHGIDVEAPAKKDPAKPATGSPSVGGGRSELRQWPIQLHLISPATPWLRGADLLLAADCVAHALGDFHQTYLRGHALAIACPKLDSNQEQYLEKLTEIIENAEVNSVEIMMMQVPCCRGLLRLAEMAADRAQRKVPVTWSIVSIEGEILQTGEASTA